MLCLCVCFGVLYFVLCCVVLLVVCGFAWLFGCLCACMFVCVCFDLRWFDLFCVVCLVGSSSGCLDLAFARVFARVLVLFCFVLLCPVLFRLVGLSFFVCLLICWIAWLAGCLCVVCCVVLLVCLCWFVLFWFGLMCCNLVWCALLDCLCVGVFVCLFD